MTKLFDHFLPFRRNIIGTDHTIKTPFGEKTLIYADWIASGRLYKPIESAIAEQFGPLVGNTHSESNFTGSVMTRAYHHAHKFIKKHVNAGEKDIIITAGSGMTGMVNKFQRILGLRIPELLQQFVKMDEITRPVVFLTHMEHHSNQTSWLETFCDVVVVPPGEDGLVCEDNLIREIERYSDRKVKIGSFSACSNVTGISTDYHRLAKIMHQAGGYAFIDFACSAPYKDINMHPEDPDERLDAIFFSPHKFLGGPGTPGVLVFNSELYHNTVPDNPGGGTVDWTNPWGEYRFVDDIEAREDGGTPPFIQTIKAALAVQLKDKMGTDNIIKREHELLPPFLEKLDKIPNLHILAGNHRDRLGIVSFYFDNIHYNLVVKILNDRYGIQVRGGCSCAGTYGHYLLNVDPYMSKRITDKINLGDLSEKPGWVRVSIHPTMSDDEIEMIATAIAEIRKNIDSWGADYTYDNHRNEFFFTKGEPELSIPDMFRLPG
ncbi:MAG: aminotransferase class V-fold PLP-dependent enzyme [Ignavibacteriales bacterium]|nr:MAG: aminotransferase class V-fold PLP-dependent enzyme [Ignavibacteriaceae bacterium]MBW7872632.1 aminotransferase class V-fold PLP-dependent enzyme [Ignavibacteria bacterium]MCZ2141814.1 aminotransferase class V-fold PLP-dependent enzyme [Ignavibacteriales bacterium]OQY75608.1 MAG: selenocysteine lyase [Ignavibacteriales bacterium UTCHB3]MBV6444982.1 Cysteine desulfurase [Ignavibacteriaceae bacterium]